MSEDPFLDLEHGAAFRVSDLEPPFRAAGSVAHIAALRNNAFKAHASAVFKDQCAFALDMLIQDGAPNCSAQQISQQRLTLAQEGGRYIGAERFWPDEDMQQNSVVVRLAVEFVERRHAVVAARHTLSIKLDSLGIDAERRFDNAGKPPVSSHPPPRIDAHRGGVILHQRALAVMLDCMVMLLFAGLVALTAIRLSL
jgi:hypothetical protein